MGCSILHFSRPDLRAICVIDLYFLEVCYMGITDLF